jgi:hypothetical protein
MEVICKKMGVSGGEILMGLKWEEGALFQILVRMVYTLVRPYKAPWPESQSESTKAFASVTAPSVSPTTELQTAPRNKFSSNQPFMFSGSEGYRDQVNRRLKSYKCHT